MQIQKEVKSNQKKLNCKKSEQPKEGHCEKSEIQDAPRNGWNGRLMAKNLIMKILVNLVPNPSETWRRQHKFI